MRAVSFDAVGEVVVRDLPPGHEVAGVVVQAPDGARPPGTPVMLRIGGEEPADG